METRDGTYPRGGALSTREGRAARAVRVEVLLGAVATEAQSPLHDRLRAARSGDRDARRRILGDVRVAASGVWPDLAAATVVPVPGHGVGPPDRWLAEIAAAVATSRGWRLERSALVRHAAASEAKHGGARDPEHEVDTLTWSPPRRDGPVVLVDDVVRTGATLDACAMRILASDPERDVVAVVLATVLPFA